MGPSLRAPQRSADKQYGTNQLWGWKGHSAKDVKPFAIGRVHTETCYALGLTNPSTEKVKTRTPHKWGLCIHGPPAVRKWELTAVPIQAVCPLSCSLGLCTDNMCSLRAHYTPSLYLASSYSNTFSSFFSHLEPVGLLEIRRVTRKNSPPTPVLAGMHP